MLRLATNCVLLISMVEMFGSWDEAVRWLRDQADCQDLVRAAYFDDPLSEAADRYWHSSEWQAIRPFLGSSRDQALDVGAGRGIASYALAREGFTSVSALEPDGSELVGAGAIRSLVDQSQLPIKICQNFSETLPFDDCSFDLIFARAVLHHTRDLQLACKEFHRVLRPGGRLLALREHVISRPVDLEVFLSAHPLHRLYGGEHAYTLSSYQGALNSAGFTNLRSLAPMDSPINYAPHTLSSLQSEIASRIAVRLPGAFRVLNALIPALWPALRPMLRHVDHRPGRLYSFIALRSA